MKLLLLLLCFGTLRVGESQFLLAINPPECEATIAGRHLLIPDHFLL